MPFIPVWRREGEGETKRTSNVVDRRPCHPHSLPLFLFCLLLLLLFRRCPKAGRRRRREKGEEVGKKKGEKGGNRKGGGKRGSTFLPPLFFVRRRMEDRGRDERGEVTWTLNSAPYTLLPFSVPSRLTTIGKERHGSKREGTGPPMHVEINMHRGHHH